MNRGKIQRKNAAFVALTTANEAIAQWRHRHYGRGGYQALPAGWAERRAKLEAEYKSALAALR